MAEQEWSAESTVGLITFVGMLALVVVPVILLRVRYRSKWRWFGIGILSWAVAFIVKTCLTGALDMGLPGLSPAVTAVLAGLISAAAELGFALVFLVPRMRSADVLAFGVGIGTFEILFKIGLGAVGAAEAGTEPAVAPGAAIVLASLVEHAVTVVGHTATRVLVYLTRAGHGLIPLALALCTFTLVDGSATYGSEAGWNWQDLGVYGPFVLFLAVIAAVETTAAVLFWRRDS